MTPVWPTDLPRPFRDGYQGQAQDPRVRRRAETGPRGHRRRFSAIAQIHSLTIDVSRDQKAVFDKFHKEDTSLGTLPFVMPDPLTDGWPLLAPDGQALLAPDDEPILIAAHWLCQFGETMPVETIRGIRFRITFPLEVLP